jgi:glycerophosphoryl diester phosphodiesterase
MSKAFWGAKKPIAIAHRGGDGAGGAKENTLEAFQAAHDLGYEYAETDIILAASGELVTVHGARNWIQAGISRGITRATLQKMTLEQMRYVLRPGSAEVPTLEEVITSFPKMKFVLDVKTNETVLPLAHLIKSHKLSGRVCVAGFEYGRIGALNKVLKLPNVSTGLTVGRGLRFKNMNMLMVKTGRLSGVEAVFIHHSLVSPPMVGLVHRRGFKAIVWTANSRIAINNAIRSGADGIISDRVELLKELIEKKTKQK